MSLFKSSTSYTTKLVGMDEAMLDIEFDRVTDRLNKLNGYYNEADDLKNKSEGYHWTDTKGHNHFEQSKHDTIAAPIAGAVGAGAVIGYQLSQLSSWGIPQTPAEWMSNGLAFVISGAAVLAGGAWVGAVLPMGIARGIGKTLGLESAIVSQKAYNNNKKMMNICEEYDRRGLQTPVQRLKTDFEQEEQVKKQFSASVKQSHHGINRTLPVLSMN